MLSRTTLTLTLNRHACHQEIWAEVSEQCKWAMWWCGPLGGRDQSWEGGLMCSSRRARQASATMEHPCAVRATSERDNGAPACDKRTGAMRPEGCGAI